VKSKKTCNKIIT